MNSLERRSPSTAMSRPGAAELSPCILESWQRCRELYKLDPETKPTVRVLTRNQWRERREKLERFLAVADPYITHLRKELVGLNFCVLVTDDHGVTVDVYNDTIRSNDLNHFDLIRGACWSEDVAGTGAIGTALYDRQPTLVHRSEHFYPELFEISCSAMPICDVDGSTLAVLNCTGLHIGGDKTSHILVYGLVVQTATMIENAWFLASHQNHWVIELSESPGFMTASADQMIAFDESGAVLAGNRAARDTLLGDARIVTQRFEEIFDAQPSELIHAACQQPGCVQDLYAWRDGARQKFHARLRGSRSGRAPVSESGTSPRSSIRLDTVDLDTMVCADPQMNANIEIVRRVIDRRLPILVLGETGSGKEVFARAVHQQSRRREKPFVALNCAAIPETLIESELFGYSPGAFTGAKAKGERGKIQQADGGTLFLDEIGDMPLPLQTRLLRVLAEGEVVSLGSTKVEKVDLNVICATHRDLPAMVAQGIFREDLYYRLNTATIRLPALRERSDLQQLLARIFSEEAAAIGRDALQLNPQILAFAKTCPWPGNIRQLRNVVRFAVAICDGPEVNLSHLPPEIRRQTTTAMTGTPSRSAPTPNAKTGSERNRMIDALRSHQWRVSAAAAAMDVARATFYRRMQRYGIVTPNQAAADIS